jgi:hypothetical protein
MTVTRDPDHVIGVWLDQMPDRVPDRVIDTVLQAVATTPQVRRLFVRGSRRYLDVNRLLVVAATIALGVILVGGAAFLAGGRNNVVGPTSSQSPTALPTFTPAASAAASQPAAVSTAPSAAPATTALGGQVPTALQARWMGSTRDFANAGAGISLLLLDSGFEIAQSNSNSTPHAAGPAGSNGAGQLNLGPSPEYCPQFGIGQYGWVLSPSGRTLTIVLVSDACPERAGDLPGTYWLMGCKDPGTNCLGELDSGVYSSQFIRPLPVALWSPLFGGVSYTLFNGWANYSDWPSTMGLTTTADFANTTASDPHPVAAVDVMTDAKALAAPCSLAAGTSQQPAEGVLLSLAGNLSVTRPATINVGGYSGAVVDVTATSGPAPTGPGHSASNCGSEVPYFFAGGEAQTIVVGEKQQLILLDLPDGHLLAIRITSDASGFDAMVSAAMPIVYTMTFK